jgi:hypothetical protein
VKIAIAGDSAGEGLAKVLVERLKGKHEVSEVSRTDRKRGIVEAPIGRVLSGADLQSSLDDVQLYRKLRQPRERLIVDPVIDDQVVIVGHVAVAIEGGMTDLRTVDEQ